MAAPGGVSIQQESDLSEHHVYVWTESVWVFASERDSVLVGIDG